jgi:hypothetical protein
MIQSLSGALAEEAKPYGSQALERLIELTERTSKHGISLIETLRNEFLESTGVELIKRRAKIVLRVEEAMKQYQQFERKIAKVFRFVSPRRNIYIMFGDIKLMQAVNKLISNAIKFTPEGGALTISPEDGKDAVLIKVEDNGIRIPKKHHPTLLTPAGQASTESFLPSWYVHHQNHCGVAPRPYMVRERGEQRHHLLHRAPERVTLRFDLYLICTCSSHVTLIELYSLLSLLASNKSIKYKLSIN